MRSRLSVRCTRRDIAYIYAYDIYVVNDSDIKKKKNGLIERYYIIKRIASLHVIRDTRYRIGRSRLRKNKRGKKCVFY